MNGSLSLLPIILSAVVFPHPHSIQWFLMSVTGTTPAPAHLWSWSSTLTKMVATLSLFGFLSVVCVTAPDSVDEEKPKSSTRVVSYSLLVSLFCVFGMVLGVGLARISGASLFQSPVVAADSRPAMVWVDPKTHAYYCEGAKRYGKTKNGKLAPLPEAQQQGYRPAYGNSCPHSQTSSGVARQGL